MKLKRSKQIFGNEISLITEYFPPYDRLYIIILVCTIYY